MRIPKKLSLVCCITMSVWLSNLPSLALALEADEMIPTQVVVEQLTRAEAQDKVQGYLNRDGVKEALQKQGISADEVNLRVASLSESELRNLALQMDQARYGGDILFTILIIVLIIFLIRRL